MSKPIFSRRAFAFVADVVLLRPWWVICGFVVAALASVVLTFTGLQMKTDQNDLVSEDLPYNQRYLSFLKEFGDLEYLYVVVEVEGDPGLAMRVSEALAEELGKLKEYVEEVHHRIPLDSFADSVLLLSPEDELRAMAKAAIENAKFLRGLERVDSLASLLDVFSAHLSSPLSGANNSFATTGFRVLGSTLESIETAAKGGAPAALEVQAVSVALGSEIDPRRRGYLFSENLKLAFVEVMATKDFQTLEVISRPLEEIRKAIECVRLKFKDARPGGVKLGLTGRPVLQADEMRTTNRDMTVSTIAAFLVVLLLFVATFRRLRRPFLACLALAAAIVITFGIVTLTIGYLTLLSIVFAAMLVGLGIDFGIHFLARYQEELLSTDDIDGSIRGTLLTTGLGIWTGGITTAAAFFSTLFVHFKGLQELGFVAGVGLIVCLAVMLVLFPALIAVTDRRIRKRRVLHPPRLVTVPALALASRRPRTVLGSLGVLTVMGFFYFKGVPYNWNLLELQATDLESVDYELKILNETERSTWFGAFIVESFAKVDETLARLDVAREAGIVGAVESIRDFIPRDPGVKKAVLQPLREFVATLRLSEKSAPYDSGTLTSSLERLLEGLERLQNLAASRGGLTDAEAVKALDGLIERTSTIHDLVVKRETMVEKGLADYQGRWLRELRGLKERLLRLLDPPDIALGKIPKQIRHRLVSDDETKFLVYAYPLKNIWEEKSMKEFVEAVRGVDPDVTGTPIQVYESTILMRDGFLLAALYSLILVAVLILLEFRNLKETVLAMAPLALGLLWMLELMPILGLSFNLANFFCFPILVGYGVDGGIHVIHRFRETGSAADVGRTTGSAVLLSSLTTIVGFGAMALAHHRGIASLGLVTALGCATTLVAAVVALPALLEIFESRRRRKAQPS